MQREGKLQASTRLRRGSLSGTPEIKKPPGLVYPRGLCGGHPSFMCMVCMVQMVRINNLTY